MTPAKKYEDSALRLCIASSKVGCSQQKRSGSGADKREEPYSQQYTAGFSVGTKGSSDVARHKGCCRFCSLISDCWAIAKITGQSLNTYARGDRSKYICINTSVVSTAIFKLQLAKHYNYNQLRVLLSVVKQTAK